MSNDDLFRAINGLARHTHWLNGPAKAFATFGGVSMFAVLLVVGWWTARDQGPAVMAAAVWAPLGALLAVLINRPVSEGLDWRAPSAATPHIVMLLHGTADTTSPSAHATLAGATSLGLYLVRKRLGVIAGVLAVLLGLSRVYVGLHYPSDAVAGLVLGAVVSAIGFVLLKGTLVQLVTRLRTSPLRPLVARVAN